MVGKCVETIIGDFAEIHPSVVFIVLRKINYCAEWSLFANPVTYYFYAPREYYVIIGVFSGTLENCGLGTRLTPGHIDTFPATWDLHHDQCGLAQARPNYSYLCSYTFFFSTILLVMEFLCVLHSHLVVSSYYSKFECCCINSISGADDACWRALGTLCATAALDRRE